MSFELERCKLYHYVYCCGDCDMAMICVHDFGLGVLGHPLLVVRINCDFRVCSID